MAHEGYVLRENIEHFRIPTFFCRTVASGEAVQSSTSVGSGKGLGGLLPIFHEWQCFVKNGLKLRESLCYLVEDEREFRDDWL